MKTDRAIIVGSVVLAAVYFYAIEQIPVRAIGDPLGPKAIPRILGVLLLISAGLLWLETRISGKAAEPLKGETSSEEQGHSGVVGAIVALTVVYFAVFELLGYAVATTVYLAVLMAYFNRGRWTANLLTAAGFSFGSYLLFSRLFGAQLARGILPF